MTLAIVNIVRWAIRAWLLCSLAGSVFAQGRPGEPGLMAHEWGTFTSVAGTDGDAVEWSPLSLGGPEVLPGFVEHLHWVAFKQGLRGTVRMETPVLYFYSPQSVNVSVHVRFVKGIITEWYPHADQPIHDGSLADADLYRRGGADGSISWNSVRIEPGTTPELPVDTTAHAKAVKFSGDSSGGNDRYYAARQTSSAPVHLRSGAADQHEKFLFYRGVASFPVPLAAAFSADGDVVVTNRFGDEISYLIRFERRGDKIGYSTSQEIDSGAVLEPPEMTARLEHLYGDLEEMLVARGLYRDEAHAMIETWRDTWFEEGSRLLYIVPARFVDSVLPLTITPAPAQITRVFVGRVELVSPATQRAVAAALAANDQAALAKYGRFLPTIMEMIEMSGAPQSQSNGSQPPPCAVDTATVVTQKPLRKTRGGTLQ